MAMELSASRLFAPYFGTSTFIWTNIIGVIMIALAIGYILGGKLADSQPQLNLLIKLIFLACIILFLIPFIVPPFAKGLIKLIYFLNSATLIIFLGSLISIAILFSLPIILLGMTSPFLIKLLSKENKVGSSAGLIFGVSTIGSIFGTFLPILVFIPWIGTAKTIIFFSSLLFIIALIGVFERKYFILLPIVFVPWFLNSGEIKQSKGKIYETESSYQYIQVADEGKFRYLEYNDGLGSQTIYNKEGILTNSYYDYYSLLPYLNYNKKGNILIIGLAGGTIANQLKYFFPEVEIDGVEIDKKVIRISQNYFNLNKEINTFNQDGRIFLEQSKKIYDLIIIDAYSHQHYIPFHLTTKEFFNLAKNHLKEKGIMAINVNAVNENSPLLVSIINTLNLIFNKVYLIKINEDKFNYLVLASLNDLEFDKLKEGIDNQLRAIGEYTFNNIKLTKFNKDSLILTDDKSPIEYLTDWMILDYLMGGNSY